VKVRLRPDLSEVWKQMTNMNEIASTVSVAQLKEKSYVKCIVHSNRKENEVYSRTLPALAVTRYYHND
jgi:hypothetical protein